MGAVDATTWLHVVLTLLAFGVGLLGGYLWWGTQFVRARLTRAEAVFLMQGQVERELDAKDAEIRRLRGELADRASGDRT